MYCLQATLTKYTSFLNSSLISVSGNPLKAAENFLQSVVDRVQVGLGCEPAGTGTAIPSGEVFKKYIARDGAVLPQVL
jgi:hypothetical protein